MTTPRSQADNELDLPGWSALDRRSPPRRGRLFRRMSPERVIAITMTTVALTTILTGWLGLRVASEGHDAKVAVTETIARVARIEDSVRAAGRRIDGVDHRVDSVAHRLDLTNYMQCVSLRRTDPAAVPNDCAPIVESRRAR